MKATQLLHNLGQSIWLDNITRDLLDNGTLEALHRRTFGDRPHLESDHLRSRHQEQRSYDAPIREKLRKGKSGEALFFELALEDLTRAADLFRPIYERTNSVDGWVSLEVSPLLAYDTVSTLAPRENLSRTRRASRTCSSKSPARRRACLRSRRPSLPASR